MKYIVDKNKKVITTIGIGAVNLTDLKLRKEFIIEQDAIINLDEAEYKDGKIIKHIKTLQELKEEKEIVKETQKEKLINNKMKEIAKRELRNEGKI